MLLLAAHRHQGRADQAFADVAHASGAAGTGVFLVEDHLLADRQAAAAAFLRPADADPAAPGQFALPGFAFLGEHVLVAGTAAEAQGGEPALQVLFEPVGHFLAEGFVLGAETDFHGRDSRIRVARRSRCQAGLPSSCSLARARLK
ncbi:hypothetical protein D9M71_92340 [compost metagenome]